MSPTITAVDVHLADETTEQLAAARVGDLFVGFPLDSVQEVLMQAAITPVPLSDSGYIGLINVRGEILSVIDLATRLGLSRGSQPDDNLVLTHTSRGLVAITVDRVTDVIHAPYDAREDVQGTAGNLFTHAYALPNRLVLVLDVERLVSSSSA